jgi:osmoprotectant transport system ATP-binding protein
VRQDHGAADGQSDGRADVRTVWLDGRDTASIRPVELRRGIGYVIQHGGLFPHRTVVENIATVPLLLGARKREARKRAEALLERV